MDNKFQTSFIPKKPISMGGGGSARQGRRPINLFSLIAGIIFLAVLALGGTVFVWKVYVQKNITQLQAATEEAKATFDPTMLDQIERLDTRIETAKKLINNHLAFSAFFDALAGVTLKSVGYDSFSYAQTGSKVAVTISGQAESFAALALQADAYQAATSVISNPVLSGIALQKNGYVSFTLTANVNSSLISYRKNLVLTTTAGLSPSTDMTASSTATSAVSTSTATTTTP